MRPLSPADVRALLVDTLAEVCPLATVKGVDEMPEVGGKRYPYTKKGKAAAKKAREQRDKKPKKKN